MPVAKKTTTSAAKAKTEAVVAEEEKVEVETKPVKPAVKKYDQQDLIPCRSVTQGMLLMTGKQSRITYRWAAYGDIVLAEYRDLYSLKSSRSQYLYDPLFVIEEEELLADPRWKDLADLYDSMYDKGDISAILNLPPAQFKSVLKQIPKGLLNAIKIEVATRMDAGTFDSILKLRAVDEVCGTDLENLI